MEYSHLKLIFMPLDMLEAISKDKAERIVLFVKGKMGTKLMNTKHEMPT